MIVSIIKPNHLREVYELKKKAYPEKLHISYDSFINVFKNSEEKITYL